MPVAGDVQTVGCVGDTRTFGWGAGDVQTARLWTSDIHVFI